MAEPPRSSAAIERHFGGAGPLAGRRVLVTAGPTHEPIDPVRYIANRSSGKQGYAIAAAARRHGRDVTLVSGPVTLPAPAGVRLVVVERAARDARGLPPGAAGGRRDLRRRRRRLARRRAATTARSRRRRTRCRS
jgi:phosphopantothenoylcysteine synthetase/decarboxylase